MSLFVNKKDTFTIPVSVQVSGDKVLCAASGDIEVISKWDSAGETKQYNFVFRSPDFKSNSEILDKSIDLIDGRIKFNSGSLRLQRMLKLLVSWDLKDDEGKDVPVNPDTIGSLNPVIAITVGTELEKVLDTV